MQRRGHGLALCRMSRYFFPRAAFRSMELAARLNGVDDPRLAKDIRDLLGAVGLSGEKKNAPQFSRGMQQRLALAQALINDPELLILDEPTAALDPAGVQQVRELLRNARHAGKSIFFSSHQLTEVEHICDRIAFLNHGRLVRSGSLREFQSESDRVEIELRGLSLAEVSRIYPAAATAGVHFCFDTYLGACAGTTPGDRGNMASGRGDCEPCAAAARAGGAISRMERRRRGTELSGDLQGWAGDRG